MTMGPTIPAWLMPLLTGLCVVGFSWLLAANKRRDEAMTHLKDCLTALELKNAKEYFGKDEAYLVTKKLDQIVDELHAQNVVLTEVRTELRSTRQAAQMAAQHSLPSGHS
jgi:hypothetical protein